MRKYMLKTGQKHRVRYIPDSVCWTEMPSTVKVLSKQRNRWARGNVDTLFKHRDTFFNPRYKLFGMMSYPFYVLFEWFTPIFEFFGFLFLIVLIIAGLADLNFFFLCLITIYLFSIYINMLALYMEERLHFSFTSLRELGKLFLFVLIEPLSYHLMNVCWTVKGNFDWLKGDKSWGEMTRRGFSQ